MTCDCIINNQTACTRECCGKVCKAMGVVMVRDSEGWGTAFAEPSALTTARDLRQGHHC